VNNPEVTVELFYPERMRNRVMTLNTALACLVSAEVPEVAGACVLIMVRAVNESMYAINLLDC